MKMLIVIFENRHVETVENMKEISNFEISKTKRKAGADIIVMA